VRRRLAWAFGAAAVAVIALAGPGAARAAEALEAARDRD